MLVINGKTFADVYYKVLHTLLHNPQYTSKPRGQMTHEITNCIIQIEDPTSNMFKNITRSTPKRYLAGELFWYFSGDRSLETISKFSKFWDKIKNPDDKTVNSAYGYLLFQEKHLPKWDCELAEWTAAPKDFINEWQWALESLKKDKDTRQALIRFNKPWHSWWGNKDFVCTLNGLFLIRDNKLHLTIIMRSQDEVFGRTFDVPFFTLLQQQMLQHLKSTYPNLTLGTYTQHNISTHLYERDFEKVANMLDTPIESDGLPTLHENLVMEDGTFNHIGFIANNTDELITWIKENMK